MAKGTIRPNLPPNRERACSCKAALVGASLLAIIDLTGAKHRRQAGSYGAQRLHHALRKSQTGAAPPETVAGRHSTQSCSSTRNSSNFTGFAR